jgi:flagellar protein FlgJ
MSITSNMNIINNVNTSSTKDRQNTAAILSGLMQSQGTGHLKADTLTKMINGIAPEEQTFEGKLKQAMENRDEKSLKEACRQFEELFLQMMYKQMKATVPKSGLFSGGIQAEIFNSILDESLMKEVSKAKGIGIADMMYKQLYKEMNNVYKSV